MRPSGHCGVRDMRTRGVWTLLSLVLQILLDSAHLPVGLTWVARISAPATQSRAPFMVQVCGTARVDVLNNTADYAEEVNELKKLIIAASRHRSARREGSRSII